MRSVLSLLLLLALVAIALAIPTTTAATTTAPEPTPRGLPPVCYHVKTGVLKLAHVGKPECADGWEEVNLNEFAGNEGYVELSPA